MTAHPCQCPTCQDTDDMSDRTRPCPDCERGRLTNIAPRGGLFRAYSGQVYTRAGTVWQESQPHGWSMCGDCGSLNSYIHKGQGTVLYQAEEEEEEEREVTTT